MTTVSEDRRESAGTPSFDRPALAELPPAAARWLRRAVVPVAPRPARVELQLVGAIRLGRRRWHRFRARELLVPDRGFVWSARTRLGGLPLRGSDAFADGTGSSRWKLLGVPVVSASGPDVDLSARQRLAAESVLLPTALIEVPWSAGPTADTAWFIHQCADGGPRVPVRIQVSDDGRLEQLRLRRWDDAGGGAFGLHEFRVDFDGEFALGGLRLPDRMRASWPDGRGEFWRARILGAQFGQ